AVSAFAGAKTAYHCGTSTPGTPASANVGRSGNTGDRVEPATASARIFPDFKCGYTLNRLGNMTCVVPAKVSTSAGAEPLYGTSSIAAPVAWLNNSPATEGAVPAPAEAKLKL